MIQPVVYCIHPGCQAPFRLNPNADLAARHLCSMHRTLIVYERIADAWLKPKPQPKPQPYDDGYGT